MCKTRFDATCAHPARRPRSGAALRGRRRRVRQTGLVQRRALELAVAVLVGLAVFDGAGSRDDALASVGIATLAVVGGVAVWSILRAVPVSTLEPSGRVAVLGTVALTLWAGVSVAWSVAGDRSWSWLGRGSVYVAFLVLGLLVGSRPGGLRRTAALMAVVLAAALAWALLGVAVPSLFEDGDRIARLREPVDYWNALALLAGGTLGLALWLLRWSRSVVRVGGAVGFYVAVVALLLTQSRAGIVGAAAVLGLWLVLSDARLADALRALVAAAPGFAVAGWAFTRPALVEGGALRADRVADGRVFAVLVVAGAVLVGLVSWRADLAGFAASRAALVRRGLAVASAALVVAAVGGLVAASASQVSGGECVNDPGRLGALCANNRLAWWEEALRIAGDHPLRGTGAGTFEVARTRHREGAGRVSEPHSVPLQLLADLGVVGLALGLTVAVAAVVGVRRTLRRVPSGDRRPAIALAGLGLAYAVHALVDYPLDFIAVTAPALVALGVLLAAGGATRPLGLGLPAAAGIAAASLTAILVVALPAVAERDVERAYTSVEGGRIERGVDLADRARQLDPLSLVPLEALAYAADAAGNEARAVAWYEEATEQQPENADTWYELGLYHFLATEDLCAAYQAFNASYTLDPRSARWYPGGQLDVARAAVDAGACER